MDLWLREEIREERKEKRARQVFFERTSLFALVIILLFCILGVCINDYIKLSKVQAKVQPIIIKVEKIPEIENEISGEIKGEEIEEPLEKEVEANIIEEDILQRDYVYQISEEDKLLFKQIISAESYDFWSEEDCLSLASVIINRYNSESFPHSGSIYEVLTTPLQFETYSNGRYLEVPISDSADYAVEAVLRGQVNLNSDVMYFCTEEFYETCSTNNFFYTIGEPVYQVRNVLFFEG